MTIPSKNHFKVRSNSPEATCKTACDLVTNLSTPHAIFFKGDVGAGKTFFCKCIGKYYGINNINSASYSMVSFSEGIINLIHCDFFRNTPNSNFFYEEIEPLLKMPWIAMIEWGDSSIWDLDCPKLEIEIDLVKDSSRDLIFRQIS